ncbi:MAG: hypothetical protein LBT30_00035 [Clostridiales bacterium]|jgi:hypothetical protein|nr:hypothetical protein [Clostridiales bacterium]
MIYGEDREKVIEILLLYRYSMDFALDFTYYGKLLLYQHCPNCRMCKNVYGAPLAPNRAMLMFALDAVTYGSDAYQVRKTVIKIK